MKSFTNFYRTIISVFSTDNILYILSRFCLFAAIACTLYACGLVGQGVEQLINSRNNPRIDYPKGMKRMPWNWLKDGMPASKDIQIDNKHTFINYEIDFLIYKNAERYGLSPRLVYAVIKYESLRAVNMNAEKARTVRSRSGAIGYMQIMPIHARLRGLHVSALENPEINIQIGCSYLASMIKLAKQRGYDNSLVESLRMYNQGPGKGDGISHRLRYRNWSNYVYPIIADYQGGLLCAN